jgi:hypothetical protein
VPHHDCSTELVARRGSKRLASRGASVPCAEMSILREGRQENDIDNEEIDVVYIKNAR